MKYIGDVRGYTEDQLLWARNIRAMEEGVEKDNLMSEFRKKTERMFPIHEPGTRLIRVNDVDRSSPEYEDGINEICRNPHLYTRGRIS